MHLFYQPGLPKGTYYLDEEESKHCVKVLRIREKEIIHVVDGKGSFYKASITQADPKKCLFEIIEQNKEAEKWHRIHIAIAPTKNADRLEWFVEKCVEMGIDEITPLLCDHSERKKLNVERLQKKAISAMKQSLKAYLPSINEAQDIKTFLKNRPQEEQKFIAYVDETIPQHLKDAAQPGKAYCVLIGPEGDFSEREIKMAFQNNFTAVSLGKSRLRTETAGMASCLILNLLNE